MINKRSRQEERLIRKLMVLIRLSNDKSIETEKDVSDYIGTMFYELDFEERRDIIVAWIRAKKDPHRYIGTNLAEEILDLFLN